MYTLMYTYSYIDYVYYMFTCLPSKVHMDLIRDLYLATYVDHQFEIC